MSPDSKQDFAASAASWWREPGARRGAAWLLPTSKDHDWVPDGSDAHDVAELGDCSVLPPSRNHLPRRASSHGPLAAFLLDAGNDVGYICSVRRFSKVRQMHEAWTVGDRNERRLVGAAGFEPATPIPPE